MKLFKYITIAFSSLFMCGCSDYLDNAPDDTLTMEMVFNDRTRTEDWLSGVYNRIPDNYWDLLKVWGYDSMGDDLDPSQRWYQWWGNSLNFIIGQWFTSSTWDAAIWSANYACVAMIIGHGMVAFRDPNGIPALHEYRQRQY